MLPVASTIYTCTNGQSNLSIRKVIECIPMWVLCKALFYTDWPKSHMTIKHRRVYVGKILRLMPTHHMALTENALFSLWWIFKFFTFLFQTNEWVHFGEYKAVWLSKRIKCDMRKGLLSLFRMNEWIINFGKINNAACVFEWIYFCNWPEVFSS